jgi:transcriptional regulator with AAA-type ATPase domain
MRFIKKSLSNSTTALILGEPGVGKRTIAHELHDRAGKKGILVVSRRRRKCWG